ncbi:MAG TPA: Wzz/FepE/Etk N-terminal domain-containing protein, partial [candidate division Zixibacteria bacterium]|nr:Wzz/FepE/Etk N-terminal domain-containing protein [candidate division Zixibacteria bacterium]
SESETNLWRLLEVIALRRSFVLSFVGLATGAAIVISLVLPKWYRAEALLLPPKEERMSVTAAGGDLAEWTSITGGLNLPVMATASDVYVRILQSRGAAVSVIDSLNLMSHLSAGSQTDALLAMAERTDFRVTPEGMIQVLAEDKDPAMAARIANAFVDELDRITRRISVNRTSQSQDFVEKSLVNAKAELDSARAKLRLFQEMNRTIDLDKQTALAIEAAATLKANLAATEVDLNLKGRTLSESHPEVVELSNRVAELREKIKELEYGSRDTSYFSLPVAETPRLTAELAELTARVKVAERLYENLRIRLDEIRIQARRESPALSILDRAVPPEIRYRPQRTLIVGATFGISLVLAVLLAVFFEYLVNLERRNPEDFRRARFFINRMFGRRGAR